MVKHFLRWISDTSFLRADILIILALAIGLYASWPGLQLYYRYTAIGVLVLLGLLALIGVFGLIGQTWLHHRRKAIDMQRYEYEQLGPYQQEYLALPEEHVPHNAHSLVQNRRANRQAKIQSMQAPHSVQEDDVQTPHSVHVQEESMRTVQAPHTSHSVQGQKSVQTPHSVQGYRPPTSAIAQRPNMSVQDLDETDRRILASFQKLIAQGENATAGMIAKDTGIARRTAYDRVEKMKKRGILL